MLVWVCCFVLIVATTFVFLANFKGVETQTADFDLADSPVLQDLDALSVVSPTVQPQRAVSTARQDLIMAVQRSRELLKQKNELYHQQKTQLIRRINDFDNLQTEYARLNAEHEDLKAQFDELWRDADSSLMMFSELLGQEVDSTAGIGANAEPTPPALDGVDLAAESSDETADQTPIEVAVLEWNLQQSQAELNQMEASLDRMSQISNAASLAMVEIGSPTIPVLIHLLHDREPINVRVWSAWMLGNMGPAATAATENLNALRADTNTELAKAAEEALRRIANEQ
jgi:hypothetical protein